MPRLVSLREKLRGSEHDPPFLCNRGKLDSRNSWAHSVASVTCISRESVTVFIIDEATELSQHKRTER